MMVGLGLIGLLCSVTAQYFAAKAAVGSTTRLRRALFAHLQTLSYTELDTIGASTMLTRLTSDMNQVQSGVNLTLRLAHPLPSWSLVRWSWRLPSTCTPRLYLPS